MDNVEPIVDGDDVTLFFDVVDNTTGALVNPGTFSVVHRTPAGVETTYTFPTDGNVTRPAMGKFEVKLTLVGAGTHRGRATSTGPNRTKKWTLHAEPKVLA